MRARTTSTGSAERKEPRPPARAALLHDLSPVEARQLAESVIAVNYRPLHDLGVSQEEAGLCGRHGGRGVGGGHVSRIKPNQTISRKVAGHLRSQSNRMKVYFYVTVLFDRLLLLNTSSLIFTFIVCQKILFCDDKADRGKDEEGTSERNELQLVEGEKKRKIISQEGGTDRQRAMTAANQRWVRRPAASPLESHHCGSGSAE